MSRAAAEPEPPAAAHPPLRVLWIEDDPDDFELMRHLLERAGLRLEAERVYSGQTLAEALARGPWDVVLADWTLPGYSCPAALSMIEAAGLDLPTIVVTGVEGLFAEEAAVVALRAGAADFLTKGRLERLPIAIRREVEHARERRGRPAG